MKKSRKLKKGISPASWILIGIPVLCIISSLMHFVYDWSGKLIIIGIIAPVNESVWEHLKMAFLPTLLWWLAGYFVLGKREAISVPKWLFSCSVAAVICPLTIISIFYSYRGAFGIESLILDVLSLYIGIAFAQGLASHIYQKARMGAIWGCLAALALIVIAAAFVFYTFYPPHIPLFLDSPTGTYGI